MNITFPIQMPRPTVAPALVVEILLLALLLVQAGRMAWAVLQPLELPPAAATTVDAGALPSPASHGDLFNRGAAAVAGAPGGAGFTLYGVRTGGSGAAAFLGRDGHQRAFLAGDDIAPGVTLASVHHDHVLLRVDGREQRLELPAAQP